MLGSMEGKMYFCKNIAIKTKEMKIRPYVEPRISIQETADEPLLAGATETLPIDNDEETEEALSKESVWGAHDYDE